MTQRASRSRVAAIAIAAAIAAGVGVSAQTSVNGHVNVIVDSAVLATALNHGSALVLATAFALATGAFPRARATLRTQPVRPRPWWFLGGLMGFVGVLIVISVTPVLGVVVVGVAVTLGQLAGSVIADSGGLGPGGRRPLTAYRAIGIVIALAAIAVGATGRIELDNAWLLPLIVLSGALIAVQQAANAWLVVVTGEFSVMSVINFSVTLVFVLIALAISAATSEIDFAAIPYWAPLGGILGAVIGVVSALTVRIVGVLSVMLCVAAGQALGGIVLDLLVPVDRVGLTAASVGSAVLAVLAVSIASLRTGPGSSRRRDRRAAASALSQEAR
ncbi:DMT family transporter [Leucobacter allii]|uniref:DMT family transporter n=1 Tax=Leucobacter allii TaxID=2932247 RepID=A0ABY4FKU2_9MICO|nr:DMT family transporter [Leucobacter allii]UOQ56873.1 DMT family transporter [Leucobacter allii]